MYQNVRANLKDNKVTTLFILKKKLWIHTNYFNLIMLSINFPFL